MPKNKATTKIENGKGGSQEREKPREGKYSQARPTPRSLELDIAIMSGKDPINMFVTPRAVTAPSMAGIYI